MNRFWYLAVNLQNILKSIEWAESLFGGYNNTIMQKVIDLKNWSWAKKIIVFDEKNHCIW